jgi:EAL domain-containing protein (putative c-di-GMP-specific phosphodiesterase class I)
VCLRSERPAERGAEPLAEAPLDLDRALEREELEVHYQPIVELAGGRIVAVEALVRWRHPSRGLVLPSEFVPRAERTGQVLKLGRWVLGAACRQAAVWHREGLSASPIEVTVNLSSTQLRAPHLVTEVREAMGAAGLDPTTLLLEITETALASDTDGSFGALSRLRSLGVRIALDDFGTGYSSPHYLARFPVDTMKIAKVFVDDVGAPGREPKMARAMMRLAEVFDLRVIAEGIERAEQAPALIELGCELGQGNHFSPPLPPDEVERLLSA